MAEAKKSFGAGRRRVYRPWIPEPGMWAQWDWGAGPIISGRRTNLFCAWLAWSRFRVVIATWDRTLPTVIACVDRAMRAFGGAATYWLTDNERTVTIDHVAGIAVRHREMVAVGGHYGITVATCVPADPESKGGSEVTVRVAKADLVPTDANLRGDYASWAELVEACEAFTAEVNARVHRVTRRTPVEMLTAQRHRLHALPEVPYTAVLGETRKVSWSSTVSFGGVTYSVPHTLADETVWVRVDGERVVVTHCAPSGPIEVARHQRSTPGHPMIDDAHYPPRPAGPLGRRPKPTSAAETEFLAIGDGARTWLVEAAAAGTTRMKTKMAQPSPLPDCTAPSGSTGRSATLRCSAASQTATWPRSWLLTRPDNAGAPMTCTRCSPAPPLGAASAPTDEPSTDRRGRRPAAHPAPAPHARRSTGVVGHRQGTTLGTGRSDARTAHRGARRPPSILNPGPAQSGRVPHPQDLRRLGRDRQLDPSADPAGAAHPRMDPPPREPRRVRTITHTPKTHFLEALGQAAVDAGHKVTWFSLEHLGALVRRHSADDTAAKAIRRIMRADVIVIDDIGLLPVTTETAEALYRVVDAAYEKRSIALSSNLHPAGFDELMPKTIANATVDRLLHHAHVVLTAGDSIRLTQATAGKGVTPLTN